MTDPGPTGTVTGTFGPVGAGGYEARAGYADVNRTAGGERPRGFRRESVTAGPQFEDGQLRLWRIWVHYQVRGDAEPLVRGFLPVQVDEGGARRPEA